MLKKLKHFICYIPSHTIAPDFETEIEAVSKDEAVEKLLSSPVLGEFDKELLSSCVMELKPINYNDYRN